MLNGNLNEARDRWADVRRLPPKSLAYQVGSAITEAELDLWSGRPADAYQRCAVLLHRDDVLDAQEGWSTPSSLPPFARARTWPKAHVLGETWTCCALRIRTEPG